MMITTCGCTGWRARYLRRLCCALLMMVSMGSVLSACSPEGAAVGDTQSLGNTVEHDGIDRNDIRLALVGASAADDQGGARLLAALDEENIHTVYASAQEVRNGQALAIQGAVDSRVSAIVLVGDGVSGKDDSALSQSLEQARRAGIPVVLVGDAAITLNGELYAAQLLPSGSRGCPAANAQEDSVAQVLSMVIDDRPHEKRICVNL